MSGIDTRSVQSSAGEELLPKPDGSVDTNLRDALGNPLSSRAYGNERGLSASIVDGGQKDSFDRIRTSSIQSIYNAYHSLSDHSLFFENRVTGTASATFVPAESAMRLAVGSASGDEIVRQTKRYIPYNPGRSYLMTFSGNFGSPKANVRQRWGYFDANDGLFFEQTIAGLKVVRRTSASGTPVDTAVAQSDFNIDKVDGTGVSGLVLNPNTHNLYVIDFVWQGAGRVRFGIVHDGRILYFHELKNSNLSLLPYLRTPSLPLRMELTNTGASASPTTFNFVCLSANKESTDKTIPSYVFSVNRGDSSVGVTSGNTRPVISIRPKLLLNGIVNRIPVLPNEAPIISISNPLLVELILNPTLTGANFVSSHASSGVEHDTSATASTGGVVIKSFFVGGLSGQSAVTSLVGITDILFLGLNMAGNAADILSMKVTNLGSGSTQVNGGFVWEEYQ